MSAENNEETAGDSDGRATELEHQIRLPAYQFYESRGREAGHEIDDWLHAEEEIESAKVRAAAA